MENNRDPFADFADEKPAAAPAAEEEVETQTTKCASCGANMAFDPATQMLVCPHCGRKESFRVDLGVEEIDIRNAFAADEPGSMGGEISFRCDNCGAHVTLGKGEVASNCPFCGTSHIVEEEDQPGIKPNAVIPFMLDKEAVAGTCKKWARKKWLAPSSFKKSIKPKNLHGVYAPCFTFDSNTQSVYDGRLGERRTRTVGSGKNRRTETYIKWFRVSGTYEQFFDDVTICSGSKFTQKQFDRIMPFRRDNAGVYTPEYLSGFMAYRYDKDVKTGWSEAKTRIDREIRSAIIARYSADVVDYLNVSTGHHDVTYKYVLVPVYVGNYTFKKKLYNLYVNGSTGKVYGKSPLSPLRVGGLVLFIVALLVGIFFLVRYL